MEGEKGRTVCMERVTWQGISSLGRGGKAPKKNHNSKVTGRPKGEDVAERQRQRRIGREVRRLGGEGDKQGV